MFAGQNLADITIKQLAKDFYEDLKVVVADVQAELKNVGKDVEKTMGVFVDHLLKFKQLTRIDKDFVR